MAIGVLGTASDCSLKPASTVGHTSDSPGNEGHDAQRGLVSKLAAKMSNPASTQRVSTAQQEAFRALVAKLEARAPVSYVALGGSMIAGEGCDIRSVAQDGANHRECAYPSRFNRWLSEKYYDSEGATSYENRALGGTTTAGALPMLPILVSDPDAASGRKASDLLLVDFAVNDAYEEQDWVVGGAANRVSLDAAQEEKVFAATEAMLRHLLKAHPSTAILLVEGVCVSLASNPAARGHRRAAEEVGVAFLPAVGMMVCGAYGRHPPNFVHEVSSIKIFPL